MLNWLTARRNPVKDHERQLVDEDFDILVDWLTADRIRRTTVIEPCDRFFPDPYDNSVASVQKHIEKLISYISRNLEPFEETGIAFRFQALRVDPALVSQPLALTASIGLQLAAQALQTGFLSSQSCQTWMNSGLPRREPAAGVESSLNTAVWSSDTIGLSAPHTQAETGGHLSDRLLPMAGLLTVLFGAGLFSANAAVPDSGCGCTGGSCAPDASDAHKSTAGLSSSQFAWALARFAEIRHDASPAWSQHLRLDVRSPFRQAQRFLQRRSA